MQKECCENTGSTNNARSTNVSIDSDKTANMDDISKSIKKQLQDSEKRMDKKLLSVFDKVDKKLDDNFKAMNDKFFKPIQDQLIIMSSNVEKNRADIEECRNNIAKLKAAKMMTLE